MVTKSYTPEQGDIILVNFNPQIGHEQKGIRPALVMSKRNFNYLTKMVIVCPITSNTKYFPLHTLLDNSTKTTGPVMCEQVRSIDYIARKIRFCEKTSEKVYNEANDLIKGFIEKL